MQNKLGQQSKDKNIDLATFSHIQVHYSLTFEAIGLNRKFWLAKIPCGKNPITRQERVITHRTLFFAKYEGTQRDRLEFVLQQYVKAGISELDQAKLPKLLQLKYHAIHDALKTLGSIDAICTLFIEFQKYLYQDEEVA